MQPEPKKQTTWEGFPVDPNEQPSDVILVWEVDPHIDSGYDVAVIRGWEDMLDFVRDVTETQCEDHTPDELQWHGVTVKIKLREMTVSDYEELQADDR